MGKNTPAANLIATRTTGGPHFSQTFQNHMMLGDKTDGTKAHSGLHSLNVALAQYPNLTETNRVETDARVPQIYAAYVRLRGDKTEKLSSFFPATMNFAAIQATVMEAWRDYKIYSPESEIYGQLAAKYNLSWAGLALIQGQKIWIGSGGAGTANNQIDTAFPAVNNKFF